MTLARPRVSFVLAAVATALLAAASTGIRGAEAQSGAAETPPPEPPAPVSAWKEVDRLLSEQKLSEAAKLLEGLESGARARKDDRELARVLIRKTQVGMALGGYETAVEALRAEAWPAEPLARAAVELYDAHALAQYLAAYGWEIAERERVVSGEKLDLKLWTRDQIAAEADRAFARVWALRDSLGGVPSADFEYLHPNDYPKGIRPTLRDAVAYLWAGRLADTSHWSPEESSETWKLDLAALSDGRGVEPTAERLGDAELHPLVKLSSILGDLERWHRGRAELGAALEARLERIGHLHGGVAADEDRAKLRASLERSLPEFRRESWWSMGMARLAAMTREGDGADDLVRARAFALEGERAYPGSPGAQTCRHERESIEAPSYSLQTMTFDAPGRRSMQVTHRNLARLHFRAFRLPSEPFGSQPMAWRGWNDEQIRPVLRRAPAASWTEELPATADYRDHRSFTTPPLTAHGGYLIVASAEPDFRSGGNRLEAIEMAISDLVVLRDPSFGQGSSNDVVRAVAGGTGRPIAGAEALVYRWEWEKRPELVERTTTDADGLARFRQLKNQSQGRGIAVVVRHGGDEAVWSQSWWWGRGQRPGETTAGTLLFTDRAIYRPGQKLFWKAVVWQGVPSSGRLRAAQQAVNVQLYDPNGEVVATADGTTNKLRHRLGRARDPDRTASRGLARRRRQRQRLDLGRGVQAADLRGRARGARGRAAPQPSGRARPARRATTSACRSPRGASPGASCARRCGSGAAGAPGGGPRRRRAPSPPARRHSTPTASSRSKFTPEADEREREGCACFRFTVEAEVTDDGGETRSGTRSVALGWVGVTPRGRRPAVPGRGAGSARRGELDGAPPRPRRRAARRRERAGGSSS